MVEVAFAGLIVGAGGRGAGVGLDDFKEQELTHMNPIRLANKNLKRKFTKSPLSWLGDPMDSSI